MQPFLFFQNNCKFFNDRVLLPCANKACRQMRRRALRTQMPARGRRMFRKNTCTTKAAAKTPAICREKSCPKCFHRRKHFRKAASPARPDARTKLKAIPLSRWTGIAESIFRAKKNLMASLNREKEFISSFKIFCHIILNYKRKNQVAKLYLYSIYRTFKRN